MSVEVETLARVELVRGADELHAVHTLDEPGTWQDLDLGGTLAGEHLEAFAEVHALDGPEARGAGAVAGIGAIRGPLRIELAGGALHFARTTALQAGARVEYRSAHLAIAAVALATAETRISAGLELTATSDAWTLRAIALGGTRRMAMTSRGQVVEGLVDAQGATGTLVVARAITPRWRAFAGASLRESGADLLAIAVAGTAVTF